MGDWFLNKSGRWYYDPDAPAPRHDPGLTMIQPRLPSTYPDGFEAADGSVYGRVNPNQLALFDFVDSRSIVDDGGPPDAA
jgi:hypothetical protein